MGSLLAALFPSLSLLSTEFSYGKAHSRTADRSWKQKRGYRFLLLGLTGRVDGVDHGHLSIVLHAWRSPDVCTFATFIYDKGSEPLLRHFTGADEERSDSASTEMVRDKFVNFYREL